jgi:hypothetical protein
MYYYDAKRAESLNNVILYNEQNSVPLGLKSIIKSIIEKEDKLNNPGGGFKEEMRYIFNIWGHGGATKEICVEGNCKRRVSIVGFHALYDNNAFEFGDKNGINTFSIRSFVENLIYILFANLSKKKKTVFYLYFSACHAGSLLRNLIFQFSTLRDEIIDSNKSHNREIEGLDTKDYCFIYGLSAENQEVGCVNLFDTFDIYNRIIEGFYNNSDEKNVSLLKLFKRFINDINDTENSVVKKKTLEAIKSWTIKNKYTEFSRSDKIGFYICYPYMIYSTNPIGNEIHDYDALKIVKTHVDKLVDLKGGFERHRREETVKHTLYDMFGSLEDTGMYLNTMGKDIIKDKGAESNSAFGSGANFKKYKKPSAKKKKSKKSKSKSKSKKISAKWKKSKSKKSRKK